MNFTNEDFNNDIDFVYNEPYMIPGSAKGIKRKTTEKSKRSTKRKHSQRDDSDSDYKPGNDSDDDEGFFFSDHSKDVYSDGNHIYFKTGVNKTSGEKLISLIEDKNKEFKKLKDHRLLIDFKPRPLYLHITSYGGSVLHAFKIIDAMNNSELPVYTIVDGYAASAGTMISVCGKKRFMGGHAYMLIHELSYGFGGKYKELKDNMKNAKRWMDDIQQLFTDYSNIDAKAFKKYRKHDLWWRYDKCKELGLVDEMWTGNINT